MRDAAVAPSSEKSSQLLIREYPHRAIAIVSSSYALIFRYSPTTGEAIADGSLTSVPSARPRAVGEGALSKCMVEFSPVSQKLLSDFRPLTPQPIYGTLGLITIEQDVFLSVVTQANRVASVRPGETVERIASVDFYCLNSAEYDDVYALNMHENDLSDITSPYGQNLGRREGEVEYPYQRRADTAICPLRDEKTMPPVTCKVTAKEKATRRIVCRRGSAKTEVEDGQSGLVYLNLRWLCGLYTHAKAAYYD